MCSFFSYPKLIFNTVKPNPKVEPGAAMQLALS